MKTLILPFDPAKKGEGRARAGLIVLIVLAAAAAGLWFWLNAGGPTDPNARVEGRVYPLDAGVDGRVAQVLVQENQTVQAGDPLVLLDEGYLNARLAETRLALEALRAGLSPAAADPGGRSSAAAEEAIRARMQAARDQESAARRDVEQLSVEHARLQLEARRLDALSGAGTPSLDRVNRARLAELTAREALEEAQRRFETISRARVTADGELDRYRAELAAAARMPASVREDRLAALEARVREAERNLAAARIVAPVAGRVTRIDATPGASVRRGQTVAAVFPSGAEHLRIAARFAPADARHVKLGQSCSVTLPEARNLSLSGIVESVGAPSSGEGVAVRIAVPDYNPETMPALRPDMKAVVRLNRM